MANSLWEDLRFALRQLRKNPGFACTAVLVLALGIAASVAIFSFVDAALLQPLPYRDPSRLVVVYRDSNSCRECELSYPDYVDFRRNNTVFSSFDAWGDSVSLWRSAAGVQAVRSAHVSGGFFRTLGASAVLGRLFADADDTPAAPHTVVLTYGAWQSRFGGRSDIVGQSLTLDDASFAVIGVLPRDFHFALRAAEFFVPIHDPNACETARDCRNVDGLARLKEGVSLQAASAGAQAMAAHLAEQYPDSDKNQGMLLKPISDAIVGGLRPTLLVLLSGACLLLLIAGVNVASLLLVRTESRRREMALRSALGASFGRLVRLFVAEGVMLAGCAVAIGLTAAYFTIPQLFNLIPERRLRGMPFFQYVGLHPRAWWFAAIVSLLAIAGFSLAPALNLSISNLRASLAEGSRNAAGTLWRRFGAKLVAAELALAVILLSIAGLLGQSLYRRLHVDLNFDPGHLATVEVDVDRTVNANQPPGLSRRLIDGLSLVPGVLSVASASELPITCNCDSVRFRVLGHPWNGQLDEALDRETSPEYFNVLQSKLLRGALYTVEDDPSKPPVIVINQALARRFFPNEDPIGKTIGDVALSTASLKRIIGIVEDIREGELEEPISPALYRPVDPRSGGGFFLAARTAQDPAAMLPALTAAIHRIDPNAGVRNQFTMTQRLSNLGTAFLNRSSAWLVGSFAALALLLAVVGLYGVVAYSVGQRTREIGVRIALGAQRGAVYRLILGEAGLVALLGIVVGMGCSIGAAALLKGLFFGVEAWDLPTLAAVAMLLGICALFASYLPARRAASVNPVEALRAE
jgi:predicted permease